MSKLREMISIFLIVLLVLLVGSASAELVIDQNYQLVNSVRIGRTEYNYTYKVNITNNGNDVDFVTATLTSNSSNIIIVDGIVQFGPIVKGEIITGNDTFTIRVNRLYQFDKSMINWKFTWKNSPKPVTIIENSNSIISPAGGKLSINGFCDVTIQEDPLRNQLNLNVEKIQSEDMYNAFKENRDDVGATDPEIIRIHSSEIINNPVAVCRYVSGQFSGSLPDDYQVELFAEVVQRSENENEITTFERLGASFDTETGKACATLSPFMFKPVSSVVAHVILGSYPKITAKGKVTSQNFSPDGVYQIAPNSSIQVQGDLIFTVPNILDKPLSGVLNITSSFGPRIDPFTNMQSMHYGADFSANHVTVFSAARGTVTRSGAQTPCTNWVNNVCKSGYGHRVVMNHSGSAGNSETRYAHLDPIGLTSLGVKESQESVGTADNSGSSTGPHLHFEYRVDGNPVDPMNFIGVVDKQKYLQSFTVVTKIDGIPNT